MKVSLKVLGSNMTELVLSSGTVLFSYETAVAAKKAGLLYVSNVRYSNTTERHIKKWLKHVDEKMNMVVYKVSQDEIDAMLHVN